MLTDINELWIGYLLLSEQFHYIQHFILFQYISCYSLSKKRRVLRVSWNQFQYISCYSLSLRAYRLVWMIVCFNTSHVTLYQGLWTSWRPHQSFQYISCYSLSPGGEKDTSRTTVSIHLMLLFILLASWGIVEWVSFNTSHVTLYQHPSGSMTMARYVSIHLMLLFIGRRISDSDRSRKVSIHLMLLFIDNWQIEWILLSYVSIHLMLLFIDFFTMSLFVKSCFNTSHVTLYPVETREYIKRWQFQYISCYSLSINTIQV